MALTGFSRVFEVEDTEYGYNTEDFVPVAAGETIKMWVPKIMGTINGIGSDKVGNNGMFDNAPDCKPSYSTTVGRQNYLSIPLKDNQIWREKVWPDGLVHKHTMFVIEFLNGNVHKRYTTTK